MMLMQTILKVSEILPNFHSGMLGFPQILIKIFRYLLMFIFGCLIKIYILRTDFFSTIKLIELSV